MAGEDQQEMKQDRVALPPPAKRRDHHLRMLFILHSIEMLGFCFSFREYYTSWV